MLSRPRRPLPPGAIWTSAALLGAGLLIALQGCGGVAPAATQLAIGTALQPYPTPRLGLVNEAGRPITLSAFRGKWLVFAPAMTLCHEVCPMTTGLFMQLMDELQQNSAMRGHVVVAEVTVDPWRDSPKRLRAFKRMTRANFTLLTGSQPEIARFWRFFGVYYQRVPQGNPPDIDWMTHKPETFDVQHSDGLFILDPAGRERVVSEGMPDVEGHLSTPLRQLLDAEGRQNLAHPQLPWTANEVIADLRQLMHGMVRATARREPAQQPTQG